MYLQCSHIPVPRKPQVGVTLTDRISTARTLAAKPQDRRPRQLQILVTRHQVIIGERVVACPGYRVEQMVPSAHDPGFTSLLQIW